MGRAVEQLGGLPSSRRQSGIKERRGPGIKCAQAGRETLAAQPRRHRRPNTMQKRMHAQGTQFACCCMWACLPSRLQILRFTPAGFGASTLPTVPLPVQDGQQLLLRLQTQLADRPAPCPPCSAIHRLHVMNAKHSFNKWHINLFHAHVIALYLCRCRPIISVGLNIHLFRDRQTDNRPRAPRRMGMEGTPIP